MQSAVHVRDRVAEFLRGELPRRCLRLRQAWHLDADRMPEPDVLSGSPPSQALTSQTRTWVNVLAPRDIAPVRRVDILDDGTPVYEYRWNISVEVWVLGDDWNTAQDAAGYLTAAARDVLLEFPTLSYDDRTDSGIALHPDTMTTQYGMVVRTPGSSSRSWSPGLISVDLRVEGDLRDGSSQPDAPIAERIERHIEAVGPQQPMPEYGAPVPRYPTNL